MGGSDGAVVVAAAAGGDGAVVGGVAAIGVAVIGGAAAAVGDGAADAVGAAGGVVSSGIRLRRRRPQTVAIRVRRHRRTHSHRPGADGLRDRPPARRHRRLRLPPGPVHPSTWCLCSAPATCSSGS